MQTFCKIGFIVLFFIALGCAPSISLQPIKETTFSIDGSWILVEMEGKKIDDAELQQERPKLDFHSLDKRVGGSTGCNQLGAGYTTMENTIQFGPISATRMACQGDLEGRFLKAIGSVDQFKIDKRNLYLMEGKLVKMVFSKAD